MKNLIINVRKIQIQKFFSPWTLVAGCIITTVFLSTGCASSRPGTTVVSPFAAIGKDADVYIFAPVSGNERLLTLLCTAFADEKTTRQYISRTSVLYAGFRYGTASSLSLISEGSYPAGLAGLVFAKKNGWEKHRASGAGKTLYYRSESADVALPSSRTAAVLIGRHPRNTDAFLQRLGTVEQPVFSPRFESHTAAWANGIAVYIPSGKHIAAALIGLQDIELPLASIEVYLQKTAETTYRYSAVFHTTNVLSAGLLRRFLGAMLTGTFSIDGAAVLVENGSMTEDQIAALLRGLLP